jgi:hypothetical protein
MPVQTSPAKSSSSAGKRSSWRAVALRCASNIATTTAIAISGRDLAVALSLAVQ